MSDVVDEDFRRSLELLPQVFDLLLDRGANEIRDDTCLEKVMSWLQESLQNRDKLCLILKSRTWHCLHSLSDCDTESYSGICLSLKLLSSLAKSIDRFIGEDDILEVAEIDMDFRPPTEKLSSTDTPWPWSSQKPTENNDVIVVSKRGDELLGHLLKIGSHLMQSLCGPCTVTSMCCWISTATELVDIPYWLSVLKNEELIVRASMLLDDKSMFVVNEAEKFLAKVILMTVIEKSTEGSAVLENDHSDKMDGASGTSHGFDQEGARSNASSSSAALFDSSFVRGLKKKLDTFSANNWRTRGLYLTSPQARKKQIDATLVQWGVELHRNVSLDKLLTGQPPESVDELDPKDIQLVGVFARLLRTSPVAATEWFEEQKITMTYCSLLGRCLLRASETNTLTELVCLQLENLKRLPKLPDDECHPLIRSVFGTVTSLMRDRTRWRSAFQMIPPLFGLCTRVHINKCSSGDAKRLAVQLTRAVLLSLSDPSGSASNDLGFSFGLATKQDLLSTRRCVMIFVEEIIREDSWSLIEELTSEALDFVGRVLRFIPSQYSLCSKPLVDRLSMQTLDALNGLLKKVPESDRNRLSPIMHQELELINSADCNNTVLEKGLKVLKTFLSLDGERLLPTEDSLMQKAKDVLEKHLMSIHWETRDSALEFVGTLTENQNDPISGWLLETKLHHSIMDKFEDEESYVRQAALNALSSLMRNKTLLDDLMKKKNLKEIDIARKVALVVIKDSGGFARRAAMKLLCTGIRRDGWIRSSVISPQEWEDDARSTSVDQCSTLAEVVFLAVATATRDFDWEVKLSALEFWGEFYTAIIPGLKLTSGLTTENDDSESVSADANKAETIPTNGIPDSVKIEDGNHPPTSSTPNKGPLNNSFDTPAYAVMTNSVTDKGDRNTLCEQDSKGNGDFGCPGNDKDMDVKDTMSWIKMVQNHTYFNLLIEKVSDEDRAVCKRACEIIIDTRNHLEKLCEYNNSIGDFSRDSKGKFLVIPSSEVDKIQRALKSLEACTKIDYTYAGCLEAFSEKMAPLLEEILSAATKVSPVNQDIDCY